MGRTSRQLEMGIIARFGSVGLSQVISDLDTYDNVIESLATQFETTASVVKAALKGIASDQAAAQREMLTDLRDSQREQDHIRNEGLERDRAHARAIVENRKIVDRADREANEAEVGRQRFAQTQRQTFLNLRRLGNQALAADARSVANAEVEANATRARSEMAYQALQAQNLRTRLEAERNAQQQMDRLHHQALIENQRWETQRTIQHARALQENRRMDEAAARANQGDPLLRVHGFAGMAAGGGFGGLTFTGRAAPAAAAAMGIMSWGAREAEQARESNFAVRRMMTLVGEAERTTGHDFRAMEAQARALARTLGISIPEAADAMREALTNAIPAGQVADFVKAANQLAMMEGNDVKTTIGSMAAIKHAFGMSDKAMVEIPDVLFAAMDRGNVKMKELANQIGQLSGMANEAGISFKEMMAALASATLKGMSGDVAATSLRNVAMKITNPTDKVRMEQERIGFRLTPERVQAMGFNEAIQQFDAALKRSGSTWAKAFSNDIRTLKIIPLLLQEGGAGGRQALSDQELAIREKRAAKGADELLDSEAKRWAKYKEEISQAGQEFGKVVSMTQLWAAKLYKSLIPPSEGEKTAGGRDARLLASETDDLRWGHSVDVEGADKQLDAAGKQYGRRFNSWGEYQAFLNRKSFAEANNQRLATPSGRSEEDVAFTDKIQASLDAQKARMQEKIAKADEKEVLRIQEKRRFLDENVKAVNKLEDAYMTLGKAITAGLEQQFEAARTLAEKLDAIAKGSKNAADTNWEKILSDRLARVPGLSGVGKTLTNFRAGSAALKEAGHTDVSTDAGFAKQQKLVGAAMGAFGHMGEMDILKIAKTGVIPYKEQEDYIENVLRSEGLRGYERTKRASGLRGEFKGMSTELTGAYREYQSLPGMTPDSGFAQWYEDKKLRETEVEGQMGLRGKAVADERRADDALDAMDRINTALIDQTKHQESIADNFRKIHEAAADFADDVEAAANVVGLARMALEDTHGKQLSGPTKETFGAALRELGDKHGFDDPLGFGPGGTPFPKPDSPVVIKAAPQTTVHIGTIMVDTVQQKEALEKKLGEAIVVKVREAQDRGAGTIDTHK